MNFVSKTVHEFYLLVDTIEFSFILHNIKKKYVESRYLRPTYFFFIPKSEPQTNEKYEEKISAFNV